MLWHETVNYNNNDNDTFYRDNDNFAGSNGKSNSHTALGQPHRPDSNAGRCNVGPILGRLYRWRANAGPHPTTVPAGASTAGEIGDNRTVSECNQSSHKSLGNVHISTYILVWVCDPTLRVYAFSRFSTKIQYHLSHIPCTIYAEMIWRYMYL